MNNQVLFIVPIYATSEEVFNDKWNRFFKKESEVSMFYKRNYEKHLLSYKYNRVVALVEVCKLRRDIEFRIYKHSSGNFRFDLLPRGGFVHYDRGRLHFRVSDNSTNISIKQNILFFLNKIVEEEFNGRYLDLDLFNVQFNLMDIKKLFV